MRAQMLTSHVPTFRPLVSCHISQQGMGEEENSKLLLLVSKMACISFFTLVSIFQIMAKYYS